MIDTRTASVSNRRQNARFRENMLDAPNELNCSNLTASGSGNPMYITENIPPTRSNKHL